MRYFLLPSTHRFCGRAKNIFQEIHADLGIAPANHGCLNSWAEQGVLLLNSVLTVEQNRAASHQGKGWEHFTDAIIQTLNSEHSGLVFLLWGSYAQKKGAIIDKKRHLVLQSVHPSPKLDHPGFFGNKHFSKANDYLQGQEKSPINWELPLLNAGNNNPSAKGMGLAQNVPGS